MTQIDVFSGFLGAGKTTLIKKLLKEVYKGQKVVLIENEFGEIGIDGGFMKEAGIEVTEMNSGCICCSLVGDFGEALQKVLDTYHPDRILIEPSGVGKLSDVVRAASVVCGENCKIGALVAVVDAGKCKMYAKNFGEFFLNQIEHAAAVVLSRTDIASDAKIADAVALIREHNPEATVITTPMDKLDGEQILRAMEKQDTLAAELEKLAADLDDDDDGECDDPDCECHHHHDEDGEHHHHHHHHHHDDDDDDDDDDECCCHHHDDDDDDDDEHDEHEHHHHHHHHVDGEECDDPDCECHHHGEHGHHHHHHHHADDVFVSWGTETPRKFSEDELRAMLEKLTDADAYGTVLRAKGILAPADGGAWIHFDYTPGEFEVRRGSAEVTGRLCVIGSGLKEDALETLFGV